MCSLFDMTSLMSMSVIGEFGKPVLGHFPLRNPLRSSPSPVFSLTSTQDEQPVKPTSSIFSQSISYTPFDSKSNWDFNDLERTSISHSFTLLPWLADTYTDRNLHRVERTELSDCNRAGS